MDVLIIDELKQHNIVYDSGKLNPNAVKMLSKNADSCIRLTNHTAFLPAEASTRERLYCVVNGVTKRQLCPECDTPLSIKKSGRLEYPTFCSRGCMYSSATRTKKRNSTMVERYGVEYTAQSPQLHQKMKDTCIDRYGVDNPFKSQIVQDQVKSTVLERYGEGGIMSDPLIKQRQQQACVDKDHKSISSKIQQSTYESQGYHNIQQQHLTTKQLDMLDDVEWLTTKHQTDKLRLCEIADIIGVDSTTISLKFKKHNIQVQRFAGSIGENQVADFMCDEIGVVVERGNRSLLGGLELDIFIPAHNIAIEYCGLYWHADIHNRIDNQYHKNKYEQCVKLGIRLITIFEDEWVSNRSLIQTKLRSIFGVDVSDVVYARKTKVVVVTRRDKVAFFNKHHIQGSGPGSINIGLECDGELVACMSFIAGKSLHYLNRYATSKRVVGGCGKLLSHFKKNYEWIRLVSFADLRWSTGALYESTGWVLDKIIPPDYAYSPDGISRIHKFNYRHKNLQRLLKQYDPNVSERLNCDANGVLRIWDCGKKRYIMDNDT